MVQVSCDEVVLVAAMRHAFVSASWAVAVRRVVRGAGALRRALIGIARIDRDRALADL